MLLWEWSYKWLWSYRTLCDICSYYSWVSYSNRCWCRRKCFNLSQGFTNGFDNINWNQVGIDAFFGGVSGLVSCSGIGIAGSVIFGGVWSGLQSIVDDKINGNDINWAKAGAAVIIGGIGGAIAGSGADVANNIGRYSTSKAFLNAGHNAARKNLMYAAKISAVKSTFIWSSVRYAANVVFSTGVSTYLSKVFEWWCKLCWL